MRREFFIYVWRSKSTGRAYETLILIESLRSGTKYHIQAGYPETQHSGKVTNWAPLRDASLMSLHVFSIAACRFSHAGSAWVAAIRTSFLGMAFEFGRMAVELPREENPESIFESCIQYAEA
jgi:hypothetical protein